MIICLYAIRLNSKHSEMKNQKLNRTPEGTCSGDVVGGLTVTGRAFRCFYLDNHKPTG